MKSSALSVTENELDELVIRILRLMNEYINCKINIENRIRSGCLDLAKARYITGNRNISSLQLPGEDALGVEAQYRVSQSNKNGFMEYKSINPVELQETFIVENFKNVNLSSDKSTTRNTGNSSKDPIKWFGFLVPQSLRQAKVTFEKCLEVVIECANIQSELSHCLELYKNRKKDIEK